MKNNKIVVVCGKHRHEVEVKKGQTITVWKLGSETNGWIPSKKHFDQFTEDLTVALKETAAGNDGHIVCHFGVNVVQVTL
jgi:hypothetical protein